MVDETDAGVRVTKLEHGSTEQKLALGSSYEVVVEDEGIMAGANISAVGLANTFVGAECEHRFLDLSGHIAVSAAPANCKTTFGVADGGAAGSVIVGPQAAKGSRRIMDRNMGGFAIAQRFKHNGAAVTETIVI
jgi:hypothetical protein